MKTFGYQHQLNKNEETTETGTREMRKNILVKLALKFVQDVKKQYGEESPTFRNLGALMNRAKHPKEGDIEMNALLAEINKAFVKHENDDDGKKFVRTFCSLFLIQYQDDMSNQDTEDGTSSSDMNSLCEEDEDDSSMNETDSESNSDLYEQSDDEETKMTDETVQENYSKTFSIDELSGKEVRLIYSRLMKTEPDIVSKAREYVNKYDEETRGGNLPVKETQGSSKHQKHWDENLETLLNISHQKNIPVRTMKFNSDEHRMSAWCSLQRRLRRRGELSQNRIDRLDAVGFVWDSRRSNN